MKESSLKQGMLEAYNEGNKHERETRMRGEAYWIGARPE